jgi:hypothetical protein
LVVASLLAGFALVLFAWLISSVPWSAVLTLDTGTHKLDFSKSFASNLTIFAAVLSTALAAKVLPSQSPVAAPPSDVVMSAGSYTALSVLFGFLVVAAPFVYAALRAGPDPQKGKRGHGWAFLVACWFTVWGAIGELATLGLIFYEARHAQPALPPGAVIPVWAVLGVAVVLVGYYSVRTIDVIIKRSSTPDTKKAGGEMVFADMEQRPKWTAL